MVAKQSDFLGATSALWQQREGKEPITTLDRVVATPLDPITQGLLETFFQRSYHLAGLEFLRLLVQYLARAFSLEAVFVVDYIGAGKARTLAFWLEQMLVDETTYDLQNSPCRQILELGEICCEADLTAVYPHFCQQLGIHANHYLGLPLQTATGQTIGHLALLAAEPIEIPAPELDVWSAVLARAALELERIRVQQHQLDNLRDVEQRAEQVAILYEMALDLTPTTDWLKLMQVLVERIASLLNRPANTLYIELYLPHNDELICKRTYPNRCQPTYLCERPSAALRTYVAQTGEAHISSTLAEDCFAYLLPDEVEAAHLIRSSVMLPLLLDQTCVGLLYVGMSQSHFFVPDQIGSLLAFGDMLANLLQRMAYITDLQTELAQAQKRAAEAHARCEAMKDLRTKLIYDVANELFTPATSIRLYLDLLAYCRLDQNARRYVQFLQEKTTHLIKFAEGALHLSRLEKRPFAAPAATTYLQRDLDHLLDLYALLAQQAQLLFRLELNESLPAVGLEPNQMRQLLAAVLDNALAYTSTGQIVVKTAVSLAPDLLCLEVVDSGIGIETADLPYLFDRFYRGKQAAQLHPTGSGLGLAIAQEILQPSGGWIEVDSQLGHGTTVRLWLPVSLPAG